MVTYLLERSTALRVDYGGTYTLVLAFLLLTLVPFQSFAVGDSGCTSTAKEGWSNPNQYCSLPAPIPSFPWVTVGPSSHIVTKDPVTLHCSVHGDHSSSSITMAWELNGERLDRTGEELPISAINAETEGEYRCAVSVVMASGDRGMVVNVSESVLVERPRLGDWLDVPTSPTQTQPQTDRHLPPGGSTILECNPHTNSPISLKMFVTWLRNDASISETDRDHVRLEPWSLMVRNFTAPRGEKIVYYKCILVGLEYHSKELERSFNLTLEEDFNYVDSMLPVDQIAVQGDNVTFYCIINSKLSSSFVTWLKDGRPLSHQGGILLDDHELVSEVLVLRNVTLVDVGVYTCVGEAGDEYNATLDIIAPPIKAYILGNRLIHNDFISNGSAVNLTCLAQSHDNTDITYQWYFRGMGVSTTNQSGVAAVGNMLMVAGGLNGSVQCFARNRAGEVSDAAILMLKPRPPIRLTIRPKLHFGQTYFGVTIHPSTEYASLKADQLRYKIRTVVYREDETSFDECYLLSSQIDPDSSGLFSVADVPIEEYVQHRNGYNVSLQASMEWNGVYSDYQSFTSGSSDGGGDACVFPAILTVTNETFILPEGIDYNPSDSVGLLNITLSWIQPQSAQTGFINFCDVSVDCGDSGNYHFTHVKGEKCTIENVSSCDVCHWTVTYRDILRTARLDNSLTFTTRPSYPLLPPSLKTFNRIRADGFTTQIYFTIPRSSSCSVSGVSLQYYNSTTITSTTAVHYEKELPLTSCSTSVSGDLSLYHCVVQLDHCWQSVHNISVAYRSGLHNLSDYSNIVGLLEGPSMSDLRLSAFTVSLVNSSWVTYSYTLTPGLHCLLNTYERAQMKICQFEEIPNGVELSPSCLHQEGGTQCRSVGQSGISDTQNSTSLRGDAVYVYVAMVTYGNSCTDSTIRVHTLEGIPSSAPRNVSAEVKHGNDHQTNMTLSWIPPPYPDQNGNITGYRITVNGSRGVGGDVGGADGNGTFCEGESFEFPWWYNSSLEYTVQACTSTGCGPIYSGTHPVIGNSPSTSEGSVGNIIIVGVVFATVIFLVVSIILSIFLCKCTKKWQKKKERQRYMALLENGGGVGGANGGGGGGGGGDPVDVRRHENTSDTQTEITEYNDIDPKVPYMLKRYIEGADGSSGSVTHYEEGLDHHDEAGMELGMDRGGFNSNSGTRSKDLKGRKKDKRKKKKSKRETVEEKCLLTTSRDDEAMSCDHNPSPVTDVTRKDSSASEGGYIKNTALSSENNTTHSSGYVENTVLSSENTALSSGYVENTALSSENTTLSSGYVENTALSSENTTLSSGYAENTALSSENTVLSSGYMENTSLSSENASGPFDVLSGVTPPPSLPLWPLVNTYISNNLSKPHPQCQPMGHVSTTTSHSQSRPTYLSRPFQPHTLDPDLSGYTDPSSLDVGVAILKDYGDTSGSFSCSTGPSSSLDTTPTSTETFELKENLNIKQFYLSDVRSQKQFPSRDATSISGLKFDAYFQEQFPSGDTALCLDLKFDAHSQEQFPSGDAASWNSSSSKDGGETTTIFSGEEGDVIRGVSSEGYHSLVATPSTNHEEEEDNCKFMFPPSTCNDHSDQSNYLNSEQTNKVIFNFQPQYNIAASVQ